MCAFLFFGWIRRRCLNPIGAGSAHLPLEQDRAVSLEPLAREQIFPRPRARECLDVGPLELAPWGPKARRGFRPSLKGSWKSPEFWSRIEPGAVSIRQGEALAVPTEPVEVSTAPVYDSP